MAIDKKKKPEELSEADIKSTDKFVEQRIQKLSSEVLRDYLSELSHNYSVAKITKTSIPDTVAYFDITSFVINEKEPVVDCLKNVYHVLANSVYSIALIIKRTRNSCNIGLAVGYEEADSEKTIKATTRLKDALLGNFPGTICSEIKTDSEKATGLLQMLTTDYVESRKMSIATTTNVTTELTDDFALQGIERLIDGIRPQKVESEYTLIILGKSLSEESQRIKKKKLYDLYTDLSPYAQEQKSYSIDKGKSPGNSVNVLVWSHTWGKSTSESEGNTVSVTNYQVKHSLDIIEKQMERIEESAALGAWEIASYVVSPDYETTNEVAHMYMSLMQGKESLYVKPAINIWNGNGISETDNIKNIFESLRRLKHPSFMAKESKDGDALIDATTIVSGIELARALNIPQKSVPGFPVFNCARFGRNISTYGVHSDDNIRLGQIYHMRRVESTTVDLDKKSLASHVFITGSTGSGKSNTVFQLLDRCNLPFLVIEPAKGEYKDVFGGRNDVTVLGTNNKLTQLLRINPFSFPKEISVCEHIDRIVEIFNICWPMYAAMPAILKDAIIRSYEVAGWNLVSSVNKYDEKLFPTFIDVLEQIRVVLKESDYSSDNKGDYTGALVTRIRSLTNGINGQIFGASSIDDSELFDRKVIIDLSRVGSNETRAMIMSLLVLKLQEYRLSNGRPDNSSIRHITVLEEAHNILKRTSTEQTSEGANLLGKSVEMLTNAIAEMRSFGEGFIIADQAPGLLDMAVIRNTNTKIIHRLPDQSDRELVGCSAGLNDEQIQELAKIECGVAAIYQNDWIEPVLCKVDEFRQETKKPLLIDSYIQPICEDDSAKAMIRDILLRPREFIKVDESLIKRSNLPARVKAMALEFCSNGYKPSENELAICFYSLYPSLVIDFAKNQDGHYLDSIVGQVKRVCKIDDKKQVKIAIAHLLYVSRGYNKLTDDAFNEIGKELSGI